MTCANSLKIFIITFPVCAYLQNLSYDLGDCTRWEYMFPNTDKPLLQIPEAEEDIMDGLDDEEVSPSLYTGTTEEFSVKSLEYAAANICAFPVWTFL